MRIVVAGLAVGIELLLPTRAPGQRVDTTRTAPDSAQVETARARGLAPVVVAGTRLSVQADGRTAMRIDGIDARNSPPGPASVADALARLPGVNLTNDQGSRAQPTVEFRGFTLSPVAGVPQGVSVFLDGVRVNEPDAQEVNFDLLPTDAIDHAELIRGPSAIFGKNTLGGALTLSTVRGGVAQRATVTADGGSFGYRGVHLLGSGMWDGVDGTLSGKTTAEDGYQVESGSTTRQLFSTLGKKTRESDLALSLLYAKDDVYEAGSLPESWLGVDRRANYSAGDFFRPELIQGAVRGSRALGIGTMRGNVFARRNAAEQFNVNAQDPDTRAFVRNRSLGGTAELDVPIMLAGLPAALSMGGEYAHTAVGYLVFNEPNAAAPEVSPNCDTQSRLCEDVRIDGDDGALFVQSTIQLTDRVSLLVAGRGDGVRVPFRDLRNSQNDDTNTFWHLSPRAGLTYLGAGHIRVYGSTGSGFRAPAALELACASPTAPCPLPFSLGADPPLRPVVAWNSELGSDWEPSRSGALHLSVFQTRVRDEIVFASSQTAAGYFENIGRTVRTGLEASGSVEPASGFTLFGSYTFLNARYEDTVALSSALDSNVVTPGAALALTPRHVADGGVRSAHVFRSLVLDATLSAHLVSSQFLRGDEANRTEPLPGYAIANFQLSVENTHTRLSASVTNVLNRHYDVFGVYATNAKGAIGAVGASAGGSAGGSAAIPATPLVERFLSPALPRSFTVSVALTP